MNMTTAAVAGFLLSASCMSSAIAQQVACAPPGTDLIVEGNKTSQICLRTLLGGAPEPRTFSYQLFGSGTWRFDSNPQVTAPSNGSLASTVATNVSEQRYMLTTSGLPITGPTPSSTNYGNFIFCYKPDINVTCVSQSLQVIRLRVDPIVRPSVSTISQDGQTPVTVTLGAAGDNATANAVVNASCTPATNGATVTVSPSSRTTNASGVTPAFTIEASNLTVYASSGSAPSSVCTFSTAAGSKSAIVTIQGRRLAPFVSVNPTFTQLPNGSTSYSHTVTVSTASPAAVNARIEAVCQGFDNGVVEPPTSTTLTTDAFGMATHTMSVSKMVAINPAPPPTARCTYTLGTVVNPPTSTIRGEQLTRLVSLSPSSINTPGSHTIVASISHPFSGFSIQASCSSSRPDVPVSLSPNCTNPDVPECKTNAMGTVAFTVSAPQLGFADPNTSANPNANCTFQLVPGGDVSTLTLPFTNVCAGTTSASPLPAACGNPL
jgi:hypothetical protein